MIDCECNPEYYDFPIILDRYGIEFMVIRTIATSTVATHTNIVQGVVDSVTWFPAGLAIEKLERYYVDNLYDANYAIGFYPLSSISTFSVLVTVG